MEQREFFAGFAAALAAASTLPEIAAAVTDHLEHLRMDLASAADEKALWERVQREFFLEPGLMHSNNGSSGSTPRSVVGAHKAYIERFEADAYRHAWSGFSDKRLGDVTPKAAEFLHADADEILLTRNTTEGMNLIATGIRLQPGDEILTTDHEHAGGINCWHHMAQMQDVVVKEIHLPSPAVSAAQILERVEDGITSRTRICSFSHLTTTTGLIMPMAQIAQITRPKGILLVCDGAQAPGILNVDVKKLMVDAYASSSHKWMLAPKGSGLLYVRKEVQDRIRPVAAYATIGSRYAAYSGSIGTRNTPMLLAHGDTMDFHNLLGRESVEARTRQLTTYLRQQLRTIPTLTQVTPDDPELSAAMTSYTVEGLASVSGLFSELKKRQINVKQTGYSSVVMGIQVPVKNVKVLRLSTHIYNSESQIDRLADAIRDIVW